MNKHYSNKIRKISPLKNQMGFTLIEMVAAIVLLGIMGMFSTQFITSAAQTNRLASGQKGLLDDAKLAMEFMVREIRVASTPGYGGAAINNTPNTQITFDKLSALAVDSDTTQIQYIQQGSNIVRISSIAGTTTLVSNVASGGFTVTTNGNAYTISMTLAGPDGTNFTLQSAAMPRARTQ